MEKPAVTHHLRRPGHGKKALRIAGMTLAGVVFAALFALVFGLLVKILWNWIMPAVFGLSAITYWQAFGIVILAKLLFGAFGSQHDHDHPKRFDRHMGDRAHLFLGIEEDEDPFPWHSHKKWNHYQQFWRDEGKEAFEAYIAGLKAEKEPENE